MKSKVSEVKKKSHKILMVDDHAIFREGLSRLLQNEKGLVVCGEATDAEEALKKIELLKPDLVIVDISLGGMNGIDLTKSLRTKYPLLFILVLSMHKEALYAERALRAGANGYIMKKESGAKLLDAIGRVLQGQTYVSNDLNESILQKMTSSGRGVSGPLLDTLSDRELEVFQFVGQGYGTRQIAQELNISMKTVESHREHIREKLGLKTNFELVQHAIHQRIA